MKGYAHPARPPFAARRPAKTGAMLRADWVSCLAKVELLADVAMGARGEALDAEFGQTLTRLTVGLRDLEPGNFPVAASSAQTMAAAFLKLARDFAHPAWTPQARTACAPFLKAGAACLDALLDALRSEEAALGRRITGEREDG